MICIVMVLSLREATKEPLGFWLRSWTYFLLKIAGWIFFSAFRATFFPPDFSDHYVGIFCEAALWRKPKPFKIFNCLTKQKELLPTIAHQCSLDLFYGTKMYILCKLLQALKPALRRLHQLQYSSIQDRVQKAHDLLLQLQLQVLSSLTTISFDVFVEQEALLAKLTAIEEAFLKQKSRIK